MAIHGNPGEQPKAPPPPLYFDVVTIVRVPKGFGTRAEVLAGTKIGRRSSNPDWDDRWEVAYDGATAAYEHTAIYLGHGLAALDKK